MRRTLALIPLLALAACGSKADLVPPPGKSLPVAPWGREARPSSAELLQVPVQAQPDRTVELRKKSEERADDPFDLRPPE
ncbi:MAG TPA: hypothetical protein PKE25_04245 [Novosphingobium sp.]|nr:hypothetical protein [Novosphingobium sp.]